jgi:hypothetical protein
MSLLRYEAIPQASNELCLHDLYDEIASYLSNDMVLIS